MNDDDGDLRLAELLDGSFGSGPDGLPAPAERLAAGRQALRRRHRAGIAGTAAAVAAVVGLGVAVSGVVGDRSSADGPAGGTTAPPSATATDPTTDTTPTLEEADLQRELDRRARKAQQRAHRLAQRLVDDQFPVSYDADHEIVVKDGWRIIQTVEEPMGFLPPQKSVGVVVTDQEDTRWMLVTLENQTDEDGIPTGALGTTAAADDPGKGYSRFEDWLAAMVDLNGGPRNQPLVTVDADDRLQPGPDAVLVETRAAPVIERYTTEGDRMAEVRRADRTWFVVVRGHGPQADVIPVDADVLSAPTFEALVDHLEAQVASGEGVR